MRRVPVYVDNRLYVEIATIPSELADDIVDALRIENTDKIDKEHRNIQGWEDLPDEWILADLIEDTWGIDWLELPRGFALRLKQMLRDHSLRVKWVYNCPHRRGEPYGKDEFSYRVHQPAAVDAIKKHKQGIYMAPTGSGKTVTFCGALWELHPERAIILVNRIELVDQWITRIIEHIGISADEIGRIGEGKWTEGRITVATIQTLWSKREELISSGWFESWDFVTLDECHHVTAETFSLIVGEFTALYRLGASATPDKTGEFEIAKATLGEVFHEDDYEALRDEGVLIAPTVEIVETEFDYVFWGDHTAHAKNDYECSVPHCKLYGWKHHSHRNNYSKMLAALVRDPDRNALVASRVMEHAGNIQIVISDQVNHLKSIHMSLIAEGVSDDIIFTLTGKQKGAERQEIIKQVESAEEAIVLSTIAGEALDIPIINRVHLPFPTKNAGKIIQQLGRGMRVADGKESAEIIDYADLEIGVFESQLRKRVKGAYKKLGLEINGREFKERESKPKGRSLGRL